MSRWYPMLAVAYKLETGKAEWEYGDPVPYHRLHQLKRQFEGWYCEQLERSMVDTRYLVSEQELRDGGIEMAEPATPIRPPTVGERMGRNDRALIAALVKLLVPAVYRSEENLIAELLQPLRNVRGFSERNLQDRFSKAKKDLAALVVE